MKLGSHHSENAKQKIRDANIGKHLTNEHKKKLSDAITGIKNTKKKNATSFKKGHEVTKHTKQQVSKATKGKPLSENHKLKISNAKKGKLKSDETKQRISKAQQGKTFTIERRIRMSEGQKGKRQSIESIKKRSGENSCLWRGGISFEPYCPKFNNQLKRRIRAFFEYRCICCGKHETENKRKLHCHHVEYDKTACCTDKPAHFAALCHRHHAMTNFDRNRWEKMIHYIINEVYEGKSYYTEKEYEELTQCEPI